MLYKNFGETDKAFLYFTKAEKASVTSRQKLVQLKRIINLLLQQGNLIKAEEFMLSAKQLIESTPTLHSQRDEINAIQIKILQLKGNIEEALKIANSSIEAGAYSYNTYKILGEIEQLRGNHSFAISCFEKSIKYLTGKQKKIELL